MKWIKVSQQFPEINSTVVIEYFSGDYEKIKYTGKLNDWWKQNVHRWLQESKSDAVPTFTLDQMRDAFETGKNGGMTDALFNNTDTVSRHEYETTISDFQSYMQEYFPDIELPKV